MARRLARRRPDRVRGGGEGRRRPGHGLVRGARRDRALALRPARRPDRAGGGARRRPPARPAPPVRPPEARARLRGRRGLLLVVVAAFVAIRAAQSFGEPVEHSGLGITVMLVFAGLSFAVARRVGRVARASHSAALEADSAHISADVWSSLGTAAALIVVAVSGWAEADAIVAIGISAWIAATGGRLALNGMRVLVDESVSQDDLDAIRDALDEARPDGVVSYHRLRARRSGATATSTSTSSSTPT
ncbi:MAG: cation diffusion facilitator family transporter [Actinobacteria bacterium]|nr:cation diffusion facilitator family transporter [Actinomycetota bacterium]